MAEPGEECYDQVIYAMKRGIREEPKSFPGLTSGSRFAEFQAVLYNAGTGGCPRPCGFERRKGGDLPRVTTTTPLPEPCHTALPGEACYDGVLWARQHGLQYYPERFKALTNTSSAFELVQAVLHESGTEGCPRPCPAATPAAAAGGEAAAVAAKGGAEQGRPAAEAAAKESWNICSPDAQVPASSSPQMWSPALTDEMRDYCYKMVVAAAPELAQGGDFGRNWCWVGMKEFGCHRHLWEHLSWEEERALAIAASGTVKNDFQPLASPEVCDKQELGNATAFDDNQWQQAKAWFRNSVAVYVLSLPQSTERKESIAKRLLSLGIAFNFVWGVDMSKPSQMEAARKEGLIPADFNISLAQEEANKPENGMGRFGSIMGTIGCASGHFRAQTRATQLTPFVPLTVIFEDDVAPEDDFVPRLWQLVTRELPCDWQAVSLSSRCPFGRCVSRHLTRVQPDLNEPAWRCRHGVNYGFQGMLYRTNDILKLQQLWKPVVFNEKRPHCLDVDVALASISDAVSFYAVPAVQNPGFLSELRQGSTRVDINWQVQKKVS